MIYKLFIYKSTAYTKDAPVIEMTNHAMGSVNKRDWETVEKYIDNIDFDAIVKDLELQIKKNEDGTCKYKCHKWHTPNAKIEYMVLNTSLDYISEIINEVKGIALHYGLVIYDKQIEKTFFEKEPERDLYVMIKKRSAEILAAIREKENPYSIHLLEDVVSTQNALMSYVVTISKNGDSFLNRIMAFDKLLLSIISPDEKIDCLDECFRIVGDRYQIMLAYEGYRKCADRIGYIENGMPVEKMICRMSCEQAFNIIPSLGYYDNIEFVLKSMRIEELVYKYPNPADRLVAICKLRKYLLKYKHDVSYDSFRWYGGHIRLNRQQTRSSDMVCSYLKIEETFATMFLPSIEKYYPYFENRYFHTDNYLPEGMCIEILKELKSVRNMLATNPNSNEAREYLAKGRCEWLLEDMKDFWKGIELMDILIYWLELQIDDAYDRDFVINITGP